MFAYVWEYRVRPPATATFLAHYGPEGSWVRLFRRAAGYRGTHLLRDRERPERFLTIDRWNSITDYTAFRARFGSEYGRLDAVCEGLTESESHLGDFEVRGEGPDA